MSLSQRHDYNCECEDCKSKFGNLPLLVQVIETQEGGIQPSTSNAETTSPNSKTTLNCPHCLKDFGHRGDLNKHIRKHTGEQPYHCDICNRKFAHTSNLNRHLRVHSGDRPYVCDNCNKSFNRKDKLESHKKSKLCRKLFE